MKKIAVLGIVLALSACEAAPKGSTVAALDHANQLHTVCLDGVEYWFREGNNSVLAPRMKAGNIGTQAHVVTCTQNDDNTAAIAGVIGQM